MYTGERRGPGRSTGRPPQHAASCRGGSNFGDCQRWGGPFPLLWAMKVLATPSRRPQATLLHAAGQGSSEHRAPHGQKPSDRPSRGSPGRGKAPCPRPALPKGPWAPRAEGDRQGGSKAWCQPGQGGGEIPKKGGSARPPGPSVIFHPAVLRDEGVDHLLHGQVGDQLVLGQGTPRDGIEMTHALQGRRWPPTGYAAYPAPGPAARPLGLAKHPPGDPAQSFLLLPGRGGHGAGVFPSPQQYLEVFLYVLPVVRDPAGRDAGLPHQLEADLPAQVVGDVPLLARETQSRVRRGRVNAASELKSAERRR